MDNIYIITYVLSVFICLFCCYKERKHSWDQVDRLFSITLSLFPIVNTLYILTHLMKRLSK